jgi:hypothetical protein
MSKKTGRFESREVSVTSSCTKFEVRAIEVASWLCDLGRRGMVNGSRGEMVAVCACRVGHTGGSARSRSAVDSQAPTDGGPPSNSIERPSPEGEGFWVD